MTDVFSQKQLSIIVPVYNVEQYIFRCLDSIYNQDLPDDFFEVILVNDGTMDNSIEVIQKILERHTNIIVINQENQGPSVARNNGIAKARGEFLLMIDSDDLLYDNSLSPLLDVAIQTKADLVMADYKEMFDEEIEDLERGTFPPKGTFSYTEKTGRQLFLEDLAPFQCNVWRTLYRREFIQANRISFVPGITSQDVPFTHEAFFKASRCIRTNWPLIIYRKGRTGSITSNFNMQKAKDLCVAIAKTWELSRNINLTKHEQYKLEENIHANVSRLVYCALYAFKDPTDRLQAINMLRQEMPDIRFRHGIMQKLETLLLRNNPQIYIKLREYIMKYKKRTRS